MTHGSVGFNGEYYWEHNAQGHIEGDACGNHQPYIASYVGDKKLFLCPSSTTGDECHRFTHDSTVSTMTFGKNRAQISDSEKWVSSMSECAMVFDCSYEWLQSNQAARLRCSHAGATNIAFMDGHVTAKKASNLRLKKDAHIVGFKWDTEPAKFKED